MTTDTQSSPAQSSTSRAPRPRLGRRARTLVLIVHIVAAAAWIGIDVLVAVLVGTGALAADPAVRGLAYQALATFVVVPMAAAALLTLISGVVLGLGTRWGLVRYWWVAVKLVMNVVLAVLIVAVLRPGMSAVGAAGEEIVVAGSTDADLSFLVFPPTVSLTVLTLAVVLAVAKPWGRLRSRRSRPGVGGRAMAAPAARRDG
jgi:hypothetical protein